MPAHLVILSKTKGPLQTECSQSGNQPSPFGGEIDASVTGVRIQMYTHWALALPFFTSANAPSPSDPG